MIFLQHLFHASKAAPGPEAAASALGQVCFSCRGDWTCASPSGPSFTPGLQSAPPCHGTWILGTSGTL